MGIKDVQWYLDRSGNPHGMAGLQIRALDMARIGQMMLDEGSWEGRRIVSKEWVRRSVEPGQSFEPTCGLLWWVMTGPTKFAVDDAVVKHFKDRGMTARSLEKLEALKGKPMARETFWMTLGPIVRGDEVLKTKLLALNKDSATPQEADRRRPARGYSAQGYLGQYSGRDPSPSPGGRPPASRARRDQSRGSQDELRRVRRDENDALVPDQARETAEATSRCIETQLGVASHKVATPGARHVARRPAHPEDLSRALAAEARRARGWGRATASPQAPVEAIRQVESSMQRPVNGRILELDMPRAFASGIRIFNPILSQARRVYFPPIALMRNRTN